MYYFPEIIIFSSFYFVPFTDSIEPLGKVKLEQQYYLSRHEWTGSLEVMYKGI